MTQRLDPKARKADILKSALTVAVRDGYDKMTRDAIASHAGTSAALVSHHLGTMPQLRRAVMRLAVFNEVLPVIARGVMLKDPQAVKAPETVKRRALRSLAAH